MHTFAHRLALLTLGCAALVAVSGCRRGVLSERLTGKGPYRIGAASQYRVAPELASRNQPQIERGRPRRILDGVAWVVGIPGKITLWDRRVDNHRISPQTEEAIGTYLAANELTAVKVRLNQYAPLDEWRRLRANKTVGWGYRYTLGTITWLGDAIFPGRVWGGDNYNPFTNTVNIYSDVPALALHEGGHAKDFSGRKWPGTYAAIYSFVPVAPLWHEGIATRDALSYLHDHGTLEEEREAYVMLYPAYGTYVGNAIGGFIPGYGTAAYAVALVGGHMAGRARAAQLRADDKPNFASRIDATEEPVFHTDLVPRRATETDELSLPQSPASPTIPATADLSPPLFLPEPVSPGPEL